MRGRMARNAFALGSAGLVVLGIAACNQSKPEAESSQTPLKIVEQVQIDENGEEVKAAEGAAPADPAGDGKATCPPVSIAMAGALNGPDAALGINIKNGVQLAIDKHNAANPGCQVQLKPFDTEGDPQKATAIAPQIVDDQYTIGLVGPAFSGETKATGDRVRSGGPGRHDRVGDQPHAERERLEDVLPRPGQRCRAGSGGRQLHEEHARPTRRSAWSTTAPTTASAWPPAVRQTLGPVADSACNISVKKGDKDFSAAVTQVKGASPDAVFYSGYYSEAAPFVQQLKDGGFTATFVSADGTKDPEFVKQAGEASKGAILSCPCGPATGAFADEYTKKFNTAPGTYSTEGYRPGHDPAQGHRLGRHHHGPRCWTSSRTTTARGWPVSTSGLPPVSSPPT